MLPGPSGYGFNSKKEGPGLMRHHLAPGLEDKATKSICLTASRDTPYWAASWRRLLLCRWRFRAVGREKSSLGPQWLPPAMLVYTLNTIIIVSIRGRTETAPATGGYRDWRNPKSVISSGVGRTWPVAFVE